MIFQYQCQRSFDLANVFLKIGVHIVLYSIIYFIPFIRKYTMIRLRTLFVVDVSVNRNKFQKV